MAAEIVDEIEKILGRTHTECRTDTESIDY
jgi:hypothetical protein